MPEIRLQAYAAKIQEMIRLGRNDEAIAHARHILGQYPLHIQTHCLLGEACLQKGMFREAAEAFQCALNADPENLIARVGLGMLHARQGDLSDAIWQMERALELSPGHPEVRRELEHLYGQQQGSALPRLRMTRTALARLYARSRLTNKAVDEFRETMRQEHEQPHAAVPLAETLWRAGRRIEAVEASLELLERLPQCLKANLILGDIWQRSGHQEAAAEKLALAESLDPENLLAQEMMGDASPLPAREVYVPELMQGNAPGSAVPTVQAKAPGSPSASVGGAEPSSVQAEQVSPTGLPVEKAPGAGLQAGAGVAPQSASLEQASVVLPEHAAVPPQVTHQALAAEMLTTDRILEAITGVWEKSHEEDAGGQAVPSASSEAAVGPAVTARPGEPPEQVPDWVRKLHDLAAVKTPPSGAMSATPAAASPMVRPSAVGPAALPQGGSASQAERQAQLLSAVEAEPGDARARIELARLLVAKRDWNGALDQYETLITARRFLPAVVEDLEPLLAQDVDRSRLLRLLGDAHAQADQLDEALQMYRQALQTLQMR